MNVEDFAALSGLISLENISIQYYPGGKVYLIPMLMDTDKDGVKIIRYTYIHCSYKIILGQPHTYCRIIFDTNPVPIENCFIPMDAKKQNTRQKRLSKLIEQCATRIIDQETARTQYAIESAVNAVTKETQYN